MLHRRIPADKSLAISHQNPKQFGDAPFLSDVARSNRSRSTDTHFVCVPMPVARPTRDPHHWDGILDFKLEEMEPHIARHRSGGC